MWPYPQSRATDCSIYEDDALQIKVNEIFSKTLCSVSIAPTINSASAASDSSDPSPLLIPLESWSDSKELLVADALKQSLVTPPTDKIPRSFMDTDESQDLQ